MSRATYTIAEAAEIFRVDPRTIRRWIAEGTLSAFRIGKRSIRIPASAVDAAMTVAV